LHSRILNLTSILLDSMVLLDHTNTTMKDIQVPIGYWAREIFSKARSYENMPLSQAMKKAVEELGPSITASVQAGWSQEESKEILEILLN